MVSRGTPEFSQLSKDWEKQGDIVARKVGDIMSGTGVLLAKNCKVVLVEGDFRYDTVPRIKGVDDTLEVTCNIDAFDQWNGIMADAPDVDEIDTQHLFLGVGMAQAELTLVTNESMRRSSKLSGAQRMAIGRRAGKILNLFQSREGLASYAERFEEEHELWGLKELVSTELKDQQVLRINQIRYGLAVGMYAMDLETETEVSITHAFVKQLKTDIEQREETLYSFLKSFAESDVDQTTKKYEKIQSYSFPELLFAGTMPMNLFEVIE